METPTGRKALTSPVGTRILPHLSTWSRRWVLGGVLFIALITIMPVPALLSGPSPSVSSLSHRSDSKAAPSVLVDASYSFTATLAANVSDVSMAYDTIDSSVVAVDENFTGGGLSTAPLETWSYANGQWSELSPSTSPTARIGASMVYDPTLGSLVLFGGLGPYGYLSDTWSFLNGNWTNISSSLGSPPAARASASLVWDSDYGAAVLYGGVGANGLNWSNALTGQTATWLLGPSGWNSVTQPSANVPPALGAIAYDGWDGYLMEFGGVGGTATCPASSSTWAFERGNWTNITASVNGSPPARWSASAAYDPSTSSVVLFGGANCLSYQNDTWSYSSDRWTEVHTGGTAPSQRSVPLLAFDASESAMVLFGGTAVNGPQADTWQLAKSTWTLEGPVLIVRGAVLTGNEAVTDSGANLTIGIEGALVGGTPMYSYLGLPTGCAGADSVAIMCAATQPGHFELTGMVSSSTGQSELPGVHVSVNAPPTFQSLVISSTATETGVPVTFDAEVLDGTGTYTYQYAGLPPGCESANVPLLTCDPSQTGSFEVSVSVWDSVGHETTATEPLLVGPHPFVQELVSSRSTVDVGLSTLISVVAGGGVGPLSFEYSGLPAGCVSSNTTGLSCSPSENGSFTVRVTALDQFGFQASQNATLTVHPRLVVPSFSANSTSVPLGSPVSFSLSQTGGTAPYQYVYSDLPVGCSSANQTTLSCSPRATGRFVVRVTVTDSLGESVFANATITVALSTGHPITGPGGTGGSFAPAWAAWAAVALAIVAAAAISLGLVARRNQRFAREGREIVEGILEEAPNLGAEFGRMDDPTRPR